MHGVGTKGNDAVKVAEHREAKDGVDSDVGTQGKGEGDRSTADVDVGGVISDHCSEVAVLGRIEIVWIMNGAAQFDGLERVGIVERRELGNDIWSLRHQPKMK